MKIRHGLTIAVVVLAATFLAYAIWGQRETERPTIRSLRTAQDADAPDGEPREFEDGWKVPSFDPRLEMLTGIDLFRVPVASRLDYPMGSANGALTYNAQPFWEMNASRGGRHTGDDLNGIGGQNSDLNDPVYAIGNGLVIYAGEPDPSWGKTLLIAHRLPDGRLIQSMYAHLATIEVPLDEPVVRGQQIGRVGNAGGQYLAHLHFEIHEADGVSLGQGYMNYRTNRLNPIETVESLRPTDPTNLGPSVSEIVQEIQRENLPFPTGF
ncbi:M23 family metallopeptidase [Roseibacillus persicicus]|uniref:M23 family metallopeptidase n=1 Tax=Roseibacillus persicicus TaxID=454148 RepID=UPI00398A81C8